MDHAAVIDKNLYQIIRKEMCSLTSKKSKQRVGYSNKNIKQK